MAEVIADIVEGHAHLIAGQKDYADRNGGQVVTFRRQGRRQNAQRPLAQGGDRRRHLAGEIRQIARVLIGRHHQVAGVVRIPVEQGEGVGFPRHHQEGGVLARRRLAGLAQEAPRGARRADERHAPGSPQRLSHGRHIIGSATRCLLRHYYSIVLNCRGKRPCWKHPHPTFRPHGEELRDDLLHWFLTSRAWGRGAAGSAIAWHAIGQRFESARLHNIPPDIWPTPLSPPTIRRQSSRGGAPPGTRPVSSGSPKIPASPSSSTWLCSPTRRARCTWGTSGTTFSATPSPATRSCGAST